MDDDEESIRNPFKSAFEQVERYYRELDGESDRAAAILAAADFEVTLRDEIATKFTRLNREIWSAIFTGYGPLSTFAAKIEIGYALGLYGRKTRKALKVAKNIRNKFAHAHEPIAFTDEEIAPDCLKLTPKNLSDPDNSRERYVRYLAEVMDHLEHAAAANAIPDEHNLPPLP